MRDKKASITLQGLLLIYIQYSLPQVGYTNFYEQLQHLLTVATGKKYSITTLRKDFSNLKKQNMVFLRKRYKKLIPAVTPYGRLAIATRLPFRNYGEWDQQWRMVVVSIPQKGKRLQHILLRKLEELGFKKFRNGVYISPYPILGEIKHLAMTHGASRHVTFFAATNLYNEKSLASDLWQLSAINLEYKKFLRKKLHPQRLEWPIQAKILESQFSSIYLRDPHLPTELLPSDWAGTRAYQHFKVISSSY